MRKLLLIVVICNLFATSILSSQEDDESLFPSSQDYYVEAFVSDDTPYIGEEILYVMRYYAYTSPIGFIDILPDFTGFWLNESYELIAPRIETVNNRQYNVQEVYGVITPLQTGIITIAPSILELPATVFRDAQILQSNQVTINVNPLPEPQPAGFVGAVGRFDMAVEVDLETITVGQPLTLSLTVIGEGNLQQLRTPLLPELLTWRVYVNSPEIRTNTDAGLRLQQKTFSWLLIPDVAGTQVIPPILFSYYDPQSESYETLTSDMFTIEVFPALDGETERQMVVRAGDDLPARVIPDELVIQGGNNGTSLWLWIVPIMITCLIAVIVFVSNMLRRRAQYMTYKNALKNAVSRLKTVHKLPLNEGLLQLKQIINQYLAEKSILSEETVIRASNDLILNGVDEATVSALEQCIIDADAGRYAPSALQIDVKALVLRTVDVLEVIELEWRI